MAEERPERAGFVGQSATGPQDQMQVFGRSGQGPHEMMRAMEGPFGPDNAVRQALTAIWRNLPANDRSVERIEQEARRLFERALAALREDGEAFGFGDPQG